MAGCRLLPARSCRRHSLVSSCARCRMNSWLGCVLRWLRLLFLVGFIFLLRVHGTNERNTTSQSYKYSHRILLFRFLDLLRFAFIQRGRVVFWMHVRPKRSEPSIQSKISQTAEKPHSGIAVRLGTEMLNYVTSRFASVGLSIAEVTATPLSAW